MNPQTTQPRPAGTRVGAAAPCLQSRHTMTVQCEQVDRVYGRSLSGVFALLVGHVLRPEARVALAATGWHTGCTARQGRKAPQEEDLASIDTVLRIYSTGNTCRNAGAAQSRGTCRTRTHTGPAPAHSVLGEPRQISATPRLPAHPLIHSAERERHGDRTSLNPGKAWPSRLHLPVDVNGPANRRESVWPPG